MATLSELLASLIYDRTQADVDHVYALKAKILNGTATPEEDVEWSMTDLKGTYNASDLNRVSETTERLGEYLVRIKNLLNTYRAANQIGASAYNDLPYEASDVVTHAKYDWTILDIPTFEQGQNYVGDIQLLRDCVASLLDPSAPQVPSINNLAWDTANDLEELLQVIYDTATAALESKRIILEHTKSALDYTDMITCGGI